MKSWKETTLNFTKSLSSVFLLITRHVQGPIRALKSRCNDIAIWDHICKILSDDTVLFKVDPLTLFLTLILRDFIANKENRHILQSQGFSVLWSL